MVFYKTACAAFLNGFPVSWQEFYIGSRYKLWENINKVVKIEPGSG
jgi:hypothetical protein